MKNKYLLISLVIFVFFVAAFMYLKNETKTNLTSNTQTTQTTTEQNSGFSIVPISDSILIKPHSPSKGSPTAKVTIVEFLDPECESCSAVYPMVKKLFDDYKSDIKLVVRYMTYHQNSKYVANILEGAREENKYWETLELLFKTQNQWANHHNPQPELIPEILKPLKLNIEKIISDAKSGKYDKQILEDVEDGKKVGVRGTPTFFINGQILDELSYEALKNGIESKLK